MSILLAFESNGMRRKKELQFEKLKTKNAFDSDVHHPSLSFALSVIQDPVFYPITSYASCVLTAHKMKFVQIVPFYCYDQIVWRFVYILFFRNSKFEFNFFRI